MVTAAWSRKQLDSRDADSIDRLPLIDDDDVVPVSDAIDIWDSWPIRAPDGSLADSLRRRRLGGAGGAGSRRSRATS